MPGLDPQSYGFDHHYGVVDDQTDGHGHSAERHQIEGLPRERHDRKSGEQSKRDGDRGEETRARVSKENCEHGHGQGNAYEDGIAHADHRVMNQASLVVYLDHADALGQTQLAGDLRDVAHHIGRRGLRET